MISFNRKNMVFKIADISKEEYIEYPVLRSIYDDEDFEEALPLSSYYYEALTLCYEKLDIEQIRSIDNYKQILFQMWICCNEDNYKSFYEIIKESSVRIRNIVRTALLNEDTPNFSELHSFLNNFQIMEKIKYYLNFLPEKYLKIAKKINNGEICVAIAYPERKDLRDVSNSYYSLSGSSKDYGGTELKHLKWKLKMHKEYDSVGELIKFFFKYDFIPCHLQDTTKRYTYYDSRESFNILNCKGNVLKNPINLKLDYKRQGKKNNFKRHYSCCEKKILSQMDFVNLDYSLLKKGIIVINKLTSFIFKILKEPCRMCRPALIGCYNIYYDDRVNYLFNFYGRPHQICLGKTSREPLVIL